MALKLEKEGKLEAIAHQGVTWVDVVNPTRKEINALAQNYPFHHLNLEDCLSKIQLTKMDQHEEYLFVLLHFPGFRTEGGNVVSNQISIFLGKDYLVTLHKGEFKSLVDMFQACKTDEQQRQAFMGKSSGFLLYRIIDKLVDDLFPMLDKVMSDLDDIEDKVFDERVSTVGEVSRLRREIGDLRRIIFPLRKLMVDIATRTQQYTKFELSPYFSDIRDHLEKAWDILEEAKETIEIYKDMDFILSTEKTNQVLAVLTMVFTLTIPASVIGALYGMNIPLPGSVFTGSPAFFGPYTTFIVLMLASVIPAVLMAWYFRRLGWF